MREENKDSEIKNRIFLIKRLIKIKIHKGGIANKLILF